MDVPGDVHRFDEQEKALVAELKELCYKNGVERNPKQSAIVLHKLGLIYKQRSPDKVSLIQSATLLNAAISRKPENVEEIKKDLEELCSNVLDVAKSSKKENLTKKAIEFKKEIIRLRLNTQKMLNTLPRPAEEKDEKLQILEQTKIKLMQNGQNILTEGYKNIMNNLCQCCEDILGKVPCKYTLVGIDSIARNEITPYSNLQAIILLEEGCQEWSSYECILNYFKRFIFVFQIIIINLRETIIQSVFIPSLNDCKKKDGDWFVDAHTTRGISFDGMVPHTCKYLPKKLQANKVKSWSDRFIKPVGEMLRYLSEEDDMLHGYCLNDLLNQTCYVFGDKSLLNQFQDLQKQQTRNFKLQAKQQTKRDLEKLDTKQCIAELESSKWFNVKLVIYRSTSLFLTALGRLHNNDDSSCFDIITSLADKGIISDNVKHNLMYAAAVACEIRLRICTEEKNQDNMKNPHFQVDSIGNAVIIRYIQIAYSLQWYLAKQLDLNLSDIYSSLALLNIKICSYLGQKDTVLQLCQKIETAYTSLIFELNNLTFDDLVSILQKQMIFHDDAHEVIEGLKSLTLIPQGNKLGLADVFLRTSRLLYSFGCYEETLRCAIKCINVIHGIVFEALPSDEQQIEKFWSSNAGYIINILHKCERFKEYFANCQEEDADIKKIIIVSCANIVGKCLIKLHSFLQLDSTEVQLQQFDQCLEANVQILQSKPSSQYRDLLLSQTYECMAASLEQQRIHEDSMEYLKMSLAIRKKLSENEDSDKSIAVIFYCMAVCWMKIEKYSESLEYFEKSLDIRLKVSDDEACDPGVADSIENIGDCLQKLGRYPESLVHFKKALDIKKKIYEGDELNEDIAYAYENIGTCLKKMKMYTESIKHLEKALEIHKSLTNDESFDIDIANISFNIGYCLLKLKKRSKSLNYFHTSLNIRILTSDHDEYDNYIAEIHFFIGVTLLEMHEWSKSLKHFKRSLAISRNIQGNDDCDENIAEVLTNIGICMEKMNKLSEALKYSKESLCIKEKLAEGHYPDEYVALSLYNVASCLEKLDRHAESLEYLYKALKILNKISDDSSSDEAIADIFCRIAINFGKLEKYSVALKYFQDSLEIKQNIKGKDSDMDIAEIINSIGFTLERMKRYPDALKHFKQSLDIKQKLLQHNDPGGESIAITIHSIGRCYEEMENHSEALDHFKKTLSIKERISKDLNSDKSIDLILLSMGQCLTKMERYSEALNCFSKMVDIETNLSEDVNTDQNIASTYFRIGICLEKTNKYSSALDYFNMALEIKKKISKDETCDDEIANTLYNIGLCLKKQKKYSKSIETLKNALDIKKKKSKDESIDCEIADLFYGIGFCLQKTRKYSESLEYFKKSVTIKQNISEDVNYDEDIADAFYNIGICFEKLNEISKSTDFFNKSLVIKQNRLEKETSSKREKETSSKRK